MTEAFSMNPHRVVGRYVDTVLKMTAFHIVHFCNIEAFLYADGLIPTCL